MTEPKPVPREIAMAIDLIALYLRDNDYLEAAITKDGSTFLRWKALPHDRSHEVQKNWEPKFPSQTMPDAN